MLLIIDYIVLNERCSMKDIAHELNLSIRQIRYNLEKINIFFESDKKHNIIETNNKGDIVIRDRNVLSDFQKRNIDHFKYSKNDRVILLMVIIAFHIERLNINEISRKLNVSRTTIKNDIAYIQKLLLQYHIELRYDKKFYLAGSYTANDLFLYRLSTIHPLEYMLYDDSISEIDIMINTYIIKEKMNGVKPRFLLPIIHSYFQEYEIYMKDFEYSLFCIVIYVYIWYAINNEELPVQNMLTTPPIDLDLQPLFKIIEKHYAIYFSYETSQFLLMLIQTLNQRQESCLHSTDDIIVSYIYQLLVHLDIHDLQPCFYDDTVLIQQLYDHINGYIKKKNIPIMNKVNLHLAAAEPLDHLLQSFYKMKKDLIDFTDCNEQSYLKLYFLSSMNRNSACLKKKVLIISGVTSAIKLELEKTLERLFEVQILKTISRYDLPFIADELLQEADYLLFTEEAPKTYCIRYKVIIIQPILNEKDIINILEKGIIAKKHVSTPVDDMIHHHSTLSPETVHIQYTDLSTINYSIIMYEDVYVSYQLHHNQHTSIWINQLHKKIYIHMQQDSAYRLLLTMFFFYKLCKVHILQELLLLNTEADCLSFLQNFM